MRRARTLLPNLALTASSLFVAAAAVEGVARLWVGRRLQGGPATIREPLLRHDPRLGWSKPPGAEAILQRPEYRQLLRINSQGLRGPERPFAKPRGRRRVLLLGDSFAEGYTVAEWATVRGALERRLQADGEGWEVINGGTHGWSTDQEYLFWRHQGARYQPDYVVLLFYMWRHTEAPLAALERDVRSAGARLLVLYVPARFEVNEGAWQLTRRRFRLGPRWKPERVFERLQATCRTLGLPLLDPRPELRTLEASGPLAYFPEDGHWTEAGHQAAATLVARALKPRRQRPVAVLRG